MHKWRLLHTEGTNEGTEGIVNALPCFQFPFRELDGHKGRELLHDLSTLNGKGGTKCLMRGKNLIEHRRHTASVAL